MKKFLAFLAVALLISNLASAQQSAGDKSIGGQINYGDNNSAMSLGAKFTYAFDSHFRLAPHINYAFKKDGVSSFDVNADLHYLISVGKGDKMAVYPLAGLTYQVWKADGYSYNIPGVALISTDDATENKFGLNLGCGFQYQINDQWRPFAEAKHVFISDFDQFVFSVGMAYHF